MRNRRRLLATVSLLWLLGSCQPPTGSNPVLERPANSDKQEAPTSVDCEVADTSLEPLTTPDEFPLVSEQFNFEPQALNVTDSEVVVETPYYAFAFCKGDETWAIASREPNSPENPGNFGQTPAEGSTDVNGEAYQYQVEAISEENIAEDDSNAGRLESGPNKDAVQFSLTLPDGEVLFTNLYNLDTLRAADLGVQIGVPGIAGAVVVDDELWIAITSGQGEGANGIATLVSYRIAGGQLEIYQPELIRGDQISAIAATGSRASNDLTLWLATQRSYEGSPTVPENGLVAYQPSAKETGTNSDPSSTNNQIRRYTTSNSPLVGAIPFELSAVDDLLWVATGNGVCEVKWQTIEQPKSWSCWQFTATADLPESGIEIYPSLLADEPAATLKDLNVEALWAETVASERPASSTAAPDSTLWYEVVYTPGFELPILQDDYERLRAAAQRRSGEQSGERATDWFGEWWHWWGDRFMRALDEVPLATFGGGPFGLPAASDKRVGIQGDSTAIRGDFELLNLTTENPRIRYYSGWVKGADLAVYPEVVAAQPSAQANPNPLSTLDDSE